MNSHVEVFMPGRLCILGEHSDWAASYRSKNKKIEKGYAIVAGLNLGVYLKGWRSDDFSYKYNDKEIHISCEELMNYFKKDFFEYVIASARIMQKKYSVRGARVICEKMTLPMKKGLASSAAICVAVIRLYNLLYDLKLSIEEEMELAYEAEISTGSMCGKMDQICAYGQGIRKICFDKDTIKVSPLKNQKELCFVLVDLNGVKDTKKILADLNSVYPFPNSEQEMELVYALGEYNHQSIINAEKLILNGNVLELGYVLNNFQKNFDKKVAVFSDELKAPRLHGLIEYSSMIDGVLACKGVGSQGDGMAQLLVESESKVDEIIEIIRERFQYECYKLKVGQQNLNAIIPIAGMGTRMYPYTQLIDKTLLPIIDSGKVYPALFLILRELFFSGSINKVNLIVNENQHDMIYRFESMLHNEEVFIPIQQSLQISNGFGGAIASSAFVQEPGFSMVCLGDYVYRGKEYGACTHQLVDCWRKYGEAVVGIKKVNVSDTKYFGIVYGTWVEDKVLKIERVVEKPDSIYAEKNLSMNYKEKKTVFAFFGEYIVNNDLLRTMSLSDKNSDKGFSEYLNEYAQKYSLYALVIDGASFDLGNPKDYYDSFIEYGKEQV